MAKINKTEKATIATTTIATTTSVAAAADVKQIKSLKEQMRERMANSSAIKAKEIAAASESVKQISPKLSRDEIKSRLVADGKLKSNPVQSNPVQSNPVQSNPVQVNPSVSLDVLTAEFDKRFDEKWQPVAAMLTAMVQTIASLSGTVNEIKVAAQNSLDVELETRNKFAEIDEVISLHTQTIMDLMDMVNNNDANANGTNKNNKNIDSKDSDYDEDDEEFDSVDDDDYIDDGEVDAADDSDDSDDEFESEDDENEVSDEVDSDDDWTVDDVIAKISELGNEGVVTFTDLLKEMLGITGSFSLRRVLSDNAAKSVALGMLRSLEE